jgi:1,4-alpha-glucan branching enzyme
MHDTLDYHARDYVYRRWHHDQLTFSMVYAFSERFVLPLSHDEVVHGKHSLIGRMPGDDWKKAAALRAMYLGMYAHPGAKLLFMGAEFGQFVEWRFHESLEWFLLGYPLHAGIQRFVRDLNLVYRHEPSLHDVDDSWEGFSWLSVDDAEHSVVAFLRRGRTPADFTIAALNLLAGPFDAYRIGVPLPGAYHVTIDSDDPVYGGSGFLANRHPSRSHVSEPVPAGGQPFSILVTLPPLSGILLRRVEAALPGSPSPS